jgi:hypothetical protein
MARVISLFRCRPSAGEFGRVATKSFRFRCRVSSPRYAKSHLLVYKHIRHVHTHRSGRKPAFRFY